MTANQTSKLIAQLNKHLAAGDRLAVDTVVGQLLAIRAPLGPQWRALAAVSQYNGAIGHARRAIRLFLDQSQHAASARSEAARLYAEIGDFEAAEATLKSLPATATDRAMRAHFLGTLALNRGKLIEARELFEEVLTSRPDSGSTWLAYVDASRSLPATLWASKVIAGAPALTHAGGSDRAAFQYALGAAYDALGDVDSAFACFDAGATSIRPTRPFDAAADRSAAEQAMQSVDIEARVETATDRPIFVFGTPRSGTTLVEQILTSHSAVSDGGELGLFDLVVKRIGGLSGNALIKAAATIGIEALAQDYLSLVADRFGPAGRIVDKTLSTQRYLSSLPTVLPEARLVWVRRNPLETAWSCYKTLFVRGVSWSFDQRTIAEHMRLDDELFAFWRDRLGDRLLVIDYEALVTEKEKIVARLLTHCRLPFEPAALEPHRNERSVGTASVSQVRQPINTSAIGAAEPYRRHLQPFIDAYRAAGGTID